VAQRRQVDAGSACIGPRNVMTESYRHRMKAGFPRRCHADFAVIGK